MLCLMCECIHMRVRTDVLMIYQSFYSTDVNMNTCVLNVLTFFCVNAGGCSSRHGEAQGGEVARSPRRKAQQEPCNWLGLP